MYTTDRNYAQSFVRIKLVLAIALFSAALAACNGGPGGGPIPPPGPTSTPSSSLSVMPNSVQLSSVGAAQRIAVQESGYSGIFGENDTCSGIATIAAGSMNGPTASYTVTGVAAGSCNVTFSDTFGQRQAVSVTVTTSGFNVQ